VVALDKKVSEGLPALRFHYDKPIKYAKPGHEDNSG
jgi:hypothetical protein